MCNTQLGAVSMFRVITAYLTSCLKQLLQNEWLQAVMLAILLSGMSSKHMLQVLVARGGRSDLQIMSEQK